MHQTRKFVLALVASIAGMACGLNAASAQDAAAPSGYQFFVTPYMWLASVHATTSTPLAHEPQVNSNVSTIDLLSHLDGAPFMGSFEVRYGALGFLADTIHLPVSTKITTHDIFYNGGNAALKANTGTGIALYRFLEDPVQFADAGLGFRAWGFSSRVALNPGLLPGVSVNPGGGWTDPLIARVITAISAMAGVSPRIAMSAALGSAPIPIGRSWTRLTIPSAHRGTCTSAIAASISRSPEAKAGLASTSI
jgi:hypothetical protein